MTHLGGEFLEKREEMECIETSLRPILVLYPQNYPGCLFLFPGESGQILEHDCMKSPALQQLKKLRAPSDLLKEARSHLRSSCRHFNKTFSKFSITFRKPWKTSWY